MGFIRVPELDLLLQHWNGLQILIKNLKRQIEVVKQDGKDDDIYGHMTNRNFDGMPGTVRIADKTAKTALALNNITGESLETIRRSF